MKKTVLSMAIFGIWTMALCLPAYAAPEDFTCPVREQRYKSIPYLTGGVGLDERRFLERIGREHNLKLVFAKTNGKYLGDVQVTIHEARGRVVLDTFSDGPWLFVTLPPGKYTVTVRESGALQSKTVSLSPLRQTRINFFWK